MSQPVVVRFAPSPTGYLHVGGARTALFNYLFARGQGGQFRLRIEDTDSARSRREYTDQILSSLSWLGLHHDGAVVYQSQRGDRYREIVQRLVQAGHAYPCFCSREELDARRADDPAWKYDGRCSCLDPEDVARRIREGRTHVIRLRHPESDITFEDLVRGPVSFHQDELDDMILVRSDGTPVYQLTVVVDDHDMGVTHVIRGDDHLSNTPKQLAIYHALGWNPPAFAHIPLILGPDRKRLSKRHGATSVEAYRQEGFVPGGLVNFLALLGWNPGDEREVMTLDELVQAFSLSRINKSPAIFDVRKAEWLNGRHIAQMSAWDLIGPFREQLNQLGIDVDHETDERLTAMLDLVKLRVRRLTELGDAASFFFRRPTTYDKKGVKKYFLKPAAEERLRVLLDWVSTIDSFSEERLEVRLRDLADRMSIKAGDLIHPLRLALTGRTSSPGIFETLVLIGQEEAKVRIRHALELLEGKYWDPTGTGG